MLIRYERRGDIHDAFHRLACALICFNYVERGYTNAATVPMLTVGQ